MKESFKTVNIIGVILSASTLVSAELDPIQPKTMLAELVIADIPYNLFTEDNTLSMAQTVSVTSSYFELSGYGIEKLTQKISSPVARLGARLGLEGVALTTSLYLPGGTTWLHEEFHRSVLAHNDIPSYNTMYDFDTNISTVSVNHVNDSSLANLKKNSPADLVRLSEAGHEGQLCLSNTLLEQAFFSGAKTVLFPTWYELISNTGYMFFSQTNEADEEIVEFNQQEPSPFQRDIVGWDYLTWVYDLHRPDESYESRGIHVTQNGVNRYIRNDQLNNEEKSYLRTQAWVSLINFVRPQLLGIDHFECTMFGKPSRINGFLEHQLTPFGNQISAHVLVASGKNKFTGTLAVNNNHHLALPEIDLGMKEIHLGSTNSKIDWSPSVSIWLQPKDLRFESREVTMGISTNQRFDLTISEQLGMFSEVSAKTQGWQAGVVDLDQSIGLRIGIVWYSR